MNLITAWVNNCEAFVAEGAGIIPDGITDYHARLFIPPKLFYPLAGLAYFIRDFRAG